MGEVVFYVASMELTNIKSLLDDILPRKWYNVLPKLPGKNITL